MTGAREDDPYRRLNYRRLIAWPERIEREGPFLEDELRRAPQASIIDLGCGTGEHVRYLAHKGFQAVGIDRSARQVEMARESEGESGGGAPRFICGDIVDLPNLTEERFGAAICLGNVLPHLDEEELGRALAALAASFLSEGRVLVQLVNYERLVARGDRHLPVNVRDDPDGEGEIVFLRLVKADGERHVLFFPSTLLLRPGEDPPLRVQSAKKVRLRAWRLEELERRFLEYAFRIDGVYGDMDRSPFSPSESKDLIVTAVYRGE